MKTMTGLLVALGLAGFAVAPAVAAEEGCQALLDKVAAAAKTAPADEATKKSVADLQAKAQEAMKAGDEAACAKAAEEALKALGAMPAEEAK